MTEGAGDACAVDERVATEQAPYTDEPFIEEFKGLDSFDSIRAAPPDPADDAVAVRGNNLPWECGEHPALGQRHNDMSQTLHELRLRQRGPDSPLPATDVESAVLISCQRHNSTPDIVNDIYIMNYVIDRAHAEAFGGSPLQGSGVPKDERCGQFGHVGTRSCQSVLPGTTFDTDTDVVVSAQSEEVTIVDAFPLQSSTRGVHPRSRFAKASRLLRNVSPVPQPTSDATGVAPQLRGRGGEKTLAMAEGTALTKRRRRKLDEGLESDLGGMDGAWAQRQMLGYQKLHCANTP